MVGRILILEDDALLLKQLQRVFARRGYDVRSTGSVAGFLAAAQHEAFDVCLFDLSLPDGCGLAAWSQARARQPGANPVLMTAYASAEVTAHAAELGVPLLTKPLDLTTLLAAVAEPTALAS